MSIHPIQYSHLLDEETEAQDHIARKKRQISHSEMAYR